MDNSKEVPSKTKNRVTIRSSNPSTEYIFKKDKISNSKRPCTPIFIAAIFTIDKTWKQPKYPLTDEWIKKKDMVYIYNGILLSHKK